MPSPETPDQRATELVALMLRLRAADLPWLRIDDGFTLHPRLLRLERPTAGRGLELLTYCAGQQDDGIVPPEVDQAELDASV